jgi:hypothetical protein
MICEFLPNRGGNQMQKLRGGILIDREDLDTLWRIVHEKYLKDELVNAALG